MINNNILIIWSEFQKWAALNQGEPVMKHLSCDVRRCDENRYASVIIALPAATCNTYVGACWNVVISACTPMHQQQRWRRHLKDGLSVTIEYDKSSCVIDGVELSTSSDIDFFLAKSNEIRTITHSTQFYDWQSSYQRLKYLGWTARFCASRHRQPCGVPSLCHLLFLVEPQRLERAFLKGDKTWFKTSRTVWEKSNIRHQYVSIEYWHITHKPGLPKGKYSASVGIVPCKQRCSTHEYY